VFFSDEQAARLASLRISSIAVNVVGVTARTKAPNVTPALKS